MTPPARLQAAIEVLDQVLASVRDNGPAADTIIARWFAGHRYAGSKDKRAIRDLVYRAIRQFGDPPVSARSAFGRLADGDDGLAALFDGSGYGPAPLVAGEIRDQPNAMPAWLARAIPVDEHAALLKRAPLDLRANRARTTRAALLAQWPTAVAIDGLDDGLRFIEPIALEALAGWHAGLVEVQDAGSQRVAAACRAQPGMTIVDLCAGGGGKTLALASTIAGYQGDVPRIVACDTDRRRLAPLALRAERAGATIEVRLLDGGHERTGLADLLGQADVVLVDAPCSGTGTLRRNPEVRWRLQPGRLDTLVATQRRVLDLGAALVRPGGALIYAVCSLLAREGAGQIDAFLAREARWTTQMPFDGGRPAGQGRILTPAQDSTDGFFVARLIAPC